MSPMEEAYFIYFFAFLALLVFVIFDLYVEVELKENEEWLIKI